MDEPDLARLISVREALRAMLLANNAGAPPPADAIEVLNEQSAEAAVVLHFDASGAELVTHCGGVDHASPSCWRSSTTRWATAPRPRLKVCPADDCLWAFYDHSRNRSGTWCEIRQCGNARQGAPVSRAPQAVRGLRSPDSLIAQAKRRRRRA